MNHTELKAAVETAMDMIIDGHAEKALAVMWVVHRGVRAAAELPTYEAPAIEERVSLTTKQKYQEEYYRANKDRLLEKDRARKQRDRERARENYWKEKHALAEQLDQQLPPMVQINDRPLRTIDVRCPTCKVGEGQKCRRMTTRGKFGKPVPGTEAPYHHPRVAAMKAANA